jgi:probable F420-dependent oxidoreductase
MKIGFNLGHEVQLDGAGMRRIAAAVDELGYHSLWTAEHIVIPENFESSYSYSSNARPQFPLSGSFAAGMTTLAHVAAVTTTVRLATGVIPMISHNPVALAKDAATVDRLSNGRLDLGIGAGWLREEAAILGMPTDSPGSRLEEAIDIMRKAWSESPFEHDGRFWKIPKSYVLPHPVAGKDLPIWIGGSGPRRLRAIVEKGALGAFLASAEAGKVAEVRAALPDDRKVGINVNIAHDYERQDMLRRLGEMEDAGADEVVLAVNRYADDVESTLSTVHRFADDLLSRYR